MKYFFARKIKYAMPSMATVVSRFSLGIVLTVLPILFAHFYGNDLAKTVALAINLSSYSSWLALGGYATVMRDFRLAKNEFEKYSLNLIYKRLAVFQSIGAILLTSVISIAYVELARPVYLIDSINLLLIGLMFGVVVQCSSFWLNVALGISYSSDNFVGVSMGVSILRILVLVVVFASSYIPINSEVILIVAMVFCGLGSLFLCRHYSIAPQAPGRDGNVKGKTFASLLAESVIYFKWSLLATAVFVFPITAISSASPDILLPATIAFFLVGASQNMVAALITPRANCLQDGVGDLAALKSYFLLTIKTSALVTAVVLSLVWLSGPFWGRYMDADNQQRFAYMATALIVMAGFRALTLAPTQAAIVLKKERLVMLAPVLEAFSSIIGISLCWFFKKGELIIWIFVLAVLIRVLVAGFWETGLIIRYWKSKERLS